MKRCSKETRSILKTIWHRKHRLLGHVLRHYSNGSMFQVEDAVTAKAF